MCFRKKPYLCKYPYFAQVTFSGRRAILCPFGLFWFSECKDIKSV